ncbi:MAG: DUF6624 domain-containing protein [Flavobacteriales bacterium]
MPGLYLICFVKLESTFMKSFFLIVIIACYSATFCAQSNPADYSTWVGKGDSLYAAGNFIESASAYRQGFVALGGKAYPKDRYNAACSYALAGLPDSSFKHLRSLYNKTVYLRTDFLSTDKDLISLHSDKRWKDLVKDLRKREKADAKHHNKKLIAELNKIHEEDQKYRQMIDSVQGNFGRESVQMDSLWKTMSYVDSLNLVKVKKILDKHGWLGPEVVTPKGSTTLFLVIQHSDQQTQERYLPIMQEAVKNRKAEASSLALLEDRVLLGQGKKQKYGSQIGYDKEKQKYYVRNLEDPMNVDLRRKEMNLGTLAEYVATWGIVWDPAEYQKELDSK